MAEESALLLSHSNGRGLLIKELAEMPNTEKSMAQLVAALLRVEQIDRGGRLEDEGDRFLIGDGK